LPYLVVVFLFVSSLVNAGGYVGAGIVQKNISGTYYEEEFSAKNSWDINQPIFGGKLIAGYGFEDGLSGEGDVILFTEGYAVGANLKYGFDLGFNVFYPHVLVGGAYTDLSGGTITVYQDQSDIDSNVVNTFAGPKTVSLKVGVGASFVVTDKIVIYSDIMMFLQEIQYSTHDESRTMSRKSEYDSLMFGMGVGVRFYMSGATSKRYNLAVEAENKRQQEIDDYIN